MLVLAELPAHAGVYDGALASTHRLRLPALLEALPSTAARLASKGCKFPWLRHEMTIAPATAWMGGYRCTETAEQGVSVALSSAGDRALLLGAGLLGCNCPGNCSVEAGAWPCAACATTVCQQQAARRPGPVMLWSQTQQAAHVSCPLSMHIVCVHAMAAPAGSARHRHARWL